MFDFNLYFDEYCKNSGLKLKLSFDMPEGYESANGTFDVTEKTVFINKELLKDSPEYEQAFYLFHELRHAMQHLNPNQFSDAILKSLQYVIMYDGTCQKLVDREYKECKLESGEDYFTNVYLGQPYEQDANDFAYNQTKAIFGDSNELRELYEFWIPRSPVDYEEYVRIYSKIDDLTNAR